MMRRTALCIVAFALFAGRPALAQMDFSGEWAPVQDEDNTGNPYVGEFLGIPMSRAGSLRAQAWNASLYTLPEWQCRPHGAMYISRGPSQVRIWKEIDPNSRQINSLDLQKLLSSPSVRRGWRRAGRSSARPARRLPGPCHLMQVF